MLRKFLAALFAALLLTALVGCSSDDSDSKESTSQDETDEQSTDEEATDEEATDEEAADDEDKAEPEARKLVEQLEESGGFGDLDDEIALCTAEAALEDEALAELLMAEDSELDPTSPEFLVLVDIIVGCDGRSYLEEAFLEGIGESADADQTACIEEVLASYDDDEFVELMGALATEDPEAMSEFVTCLA